MGNKLVFFQRIGLDMKREGLLRKANYLANIENHGEVSDLSELFINTLKGRGKDKREKELNYIFSQFPKEIQDKIDGGKINKSDLVKHVNACIINNEGFYNPEIFDKKDLKSERLIELIGKRENRTISKGETSLLNRYLLESTFYGWEFIQLKTIKEKCEREVFSSLFMYGNENLKSDFFQSLIDSSSAKNVAEQILGINMNKLGKSCGVQYLLMDLYLDTIHQYEKEGRLPAGFPLKEFKNSINESMKINYNDLAHCTYQLQGLEEKNRFLIIPITLSYERSVAHVCCCLVKKDFSQDNQYSFTLVNAGARPNYVQGEGQYQEYVLSKKNLMKILEDAKAGRFIDRFYSRLENDSNEKYTLNISSAEQKVGNCHIHSLRKGLDFQVNSLLTKDYDQKEFRLPYNSDDYSENKHRNKLFKSFDSKVNLDENTEIAKTRLMYNLVKKLPAYEAEIMGSLEEYRLQKIASQKFFNALEKYYEKDPWKLIQFVKQMEKNDKMIPPNLPYSEVVKKLKEKLSKAAIMNVNKDSLIDRMRDMEFTTDPCNREIYMEADRAINKLEQYKKKSSENQKSRTLNMDRKSSDKDLGREM